MSVRRNLPALAVALLMAALALPLFAEFFEPGQVGWDLFLGLFLIGLIVAAVRLARFLSDHAAEIGEARFDTTNKGDARG